MNDLAIYSTTNRIYLSGIVPGHSRFVFNGDSLSGMVIPTPGMVARSIAVNPTTDRVYVVVQPTSGSPNILVVDATTNQPVATIPSVVGYGGYHSIEVNPLTNRVYATLPGLPTPGASGAVAVIDGTTKSVLTTIPVGVGPQARAADPGAQRLYVANFFSDTVSVIDTKTNSVVATVPVGGYPADVIVEPPTRQVFVANARTGTVSVLQA